MRPEGVKLGLAGRLHVLLMLVTLLLLVLVVAGEVAHSRTLIWLDPARMLVSFAAAAIPCIGRIALFEQIVAVLEGRRVEALVMGVECLPAASVLLGTVQLEETGRVVVFGWLLRSVVRRLNLIDGFDAEHAQAARGGDPAGWARPVLVDLQVARRVWIHRSRG